MNQFFSYKRPVISPPKGNLYRGEKIISVYLVKIFFEKYQIIMLLNFYLLLT